MSDLPLHFAVTDEASANWVVRKVLEARAYAARTEQWAAAEVRRARAEERFFLERFGLQLEQCVAQELEHRGHRRRSLHLPAGTVGYRLSRPRLQLIDLVTAVRWCRQHLPSALRVGVEATGHQAIDVADWCRSQCSGVAVSERVLQSGLVEYVQSTGELPDGTEVADVRDQFYIR